MKGGKTFSLFLRYSCDFGSTLFWLSKCLHHAAFILTCLTGWFFSRVQCSYIWGNQILNVYGCDADWNKYVVIKIFIEFNTLIIYANYYKSRALVYISIATRNHSRGNKHTQKEQSNISRLKPLLNTNCYINDGLWEQLLFHSLNQNLNKQNEAKQCILPVCNIW